MDILQLLDNFGIEEYDINDDGSVDVYDSVYITGNTGMGQLPIKFGKVNGHFYCNGNDLTTLEGCPTEVTNNFFCNFNKLTSLKGCPNYLGGDFSCSNNYLTELDYLPKEIKGYINCNDNKLTTLKGCPEHLKDLFCRNNKLTSLEYSPSRIDEVFDFSYNEIRDLYGISDYIGNDIQFYGGRNPIESIITKPVDIDFIKRFNSYKVIKDERVDLKRLKYLMEVSEMDYDIEKIKKHYEII